MKKEQSIRLIVNADDFGQCEGINRGVIFAHEHGIVTSASLMVRYPAAAAAGAYAQSNPSLGIGLHIDLGEWQLQGGEWIARYEVVDLNSSSEVESEIRTQLGLFRRLIGRSPTHIDSHQHIHLRKELLPVFKSISRSCNVPLRHTDRRVRYCGAFYGQDKSGGEYNIGVSAPRLNSILNSLLPGTTELACHPGFDIDVSTMYRLQRDLEVQALCDPEVRTAIRRRGIELVNFGSLTDGQPGFYTKEKYQQ